ncbi:MAG: hypothetical protein KDE26_19825 [Bacteroidetes bacterium]|nr:hypothetical protein [Bacteroidota bacterium]
MVLFLAQQSGCNPPSGYGVAFHVFDLSGVCEQTDLQAFFLDQFVRHLQGDVFPADSVFHYQLDGLHVEQLGQSLYFLQVKIFLAFLKGGQPVFGAAENFVQPLVIRGRDILV